ncbi:MULTISPECIES: phospholipase D-like domain-containing protein [unclassified Methylobacterium]|uniref:phospholipase D-like domain-containing protein n=1 Tax=unclassified Methylobacterium TaxID=2615210 RepID=UPI000152C995|nr:MULTISPECIES: phospholipase D-like domain-containing protein [Methylobacterium]WFT81885.1 phospholipase D-like domain-containing protein [Methylobacterium nodulans]
MQELVSAWFGLLSAIRVEGLAALGFVLALAVTLHALLNKREVAAAIGWIGLAWLSPLAGSALYALFGINRVTRRARRLPVLPVRKPGVPQADPVTVPGPFLPLEQAGDRLTGLPLTGGNRVALLRHGDEAYPAMLAAIEGARETVGLSSYIMRDDVSGEAFVAALARAKARGVAICVLVDGIGSGYFFPAIYRRLRREGIPAGLFMHSAVPWRMPFLNLRTHKKLLVIDGRTGFVGGVNIGDENLVSRHPPEPVRDTHFLLEGPVVGQLAQAFARDWSFVTGEDLDGPGWFPAIPPAGDTPARVVTSGPDADIEKIEYVVLAALAVARHSIRLATPYFLPSEILLTSLALAAMRGIAVDVIIPQASNHRMVDWATRAHVAPLLRSGVRIWLDRPPFDHSKLMVVDDAWCFVGSANWDTRSFRLNFELNVELYDEAFAAELNRLLAAKMQVPLTLDALTARGMPVRLRDAGVRLLLPYL